MALQCLLITRDAALLAAIRSFFTEARIELDLRRDAASGIELATSRHLDGFVVDCDDLPGGNEAVSQLRQCRSNKLSTIIAVVNGATSLATAMALGANFVIRKPVDERRLRDILEVALPKMEREHRRYFRYPADLAVELHLPSGTVRQAHMVNISEGGMAIHLPDSADLEGVLTVRFDLPSTEVRNFSAKAEVTWKARANTGLRFLYLAADCRSAFEAWLDSLESQLRFREAMQAGASQSS